MFGWLKPRCPLTTAEKVWVESRMSWLAETVGIERLIDARVVEPTDEFFPGNSEGSDDDASAEAVAPLLFDHDPDVSGTAARVLGAIGAAAKPYIADLHSLLVSRRASDREGAAFALGELRPEDSHVIRDLARLLDDEDMAVVSAAADALGKYGSAVGTLAPQILRRYEKALVKCHFSLMDSLASSLNRVLPSAGSIVREYFEHDPELCRLAIESLEGHSGGEFQE
jgi:hypothetical protein